MQVDLDAQLAVLIRSQVESGRYADANDVIREAVQLLAERDRVRRLRASLAEADGQIDRGEYVVWTPDLLEELSQEAEELARQGKQPHPDDRLAAMTGPLTTTNRR